MKNYIEINYPEIYQIYCHATKFYENQLNKIYKIEAENENLLIFKQIQLQFSLIAKQDLESIFLLFQNEQFYSPQIILRSLLEYVITLGYIELNPESHSKQYALHGLKSNLKTVNALKNSKNELLDLSLLEKRCKELQDEKNRFENEIDNWLANLESRAQKSGLESLYIAYRYLSMLAHPNSNNSNYFFKEEPDKVIFHDFTEDTTFRTLLISLLFTNVLFSKLNEIFELENENEYENIQDQIKCLLDKN